jgi:hypothetical protein
MWPYSLGVMVPLAFGSILVTRAVVGRLLLFTFGVPKPPAGPERTPLYRWVHPFATGMTAMSGWVVLESLFRTFSAYGPWEGRLLATALCGGALVLCSISWVLNAARRNSFPPAVIFVFLSLMLLGSITFPVTHDTIFANFEITGDVSRRLFVGTVALLLLYALVLAVVLMRFGYAKKA